MPMSAPMHCPVGVTKAEDYNEGGEMYVVALGRCEALENVFRTSKLA